VHAARRNQRRSAEGWVNTTGRAKSILHRVLHTLPLVRNSGFDFGNMKDKESVDEVGVVGKLWRCSILGFTGQPPTHLNRAIQIMPYLQGPKA
jgi:hypothetical protein